jgi:hypothetical protein
VVGEIPGTTKADEVEYATRTHHSNVDLYDRVHQGDVMQGRGHRGMVCVQHSYSRRDAATKSNAAPLTK